jgi:hypothetical protein
MYRAVPTALLRPLPLAFRPELPARADSSGMLPLPPCLRISNRPPRRLEITVSYTKQTIGALSNRPNSGPSGHHLVFSLRRPPILQPVLEYPWSPKQALPRRRPWPPRRLPATLLQLGFSISSLEATLSRFLAATKIDYPTRIVILSDQREPKDLSSFPFPETPLLTNRGLQRAVARSFCEGWPRLTPLSTPPPQLPPLPSPPLCYSHRRTRVPPIGLRAQAPAHPISKREPSPIPSRVKAPGSSPCGPTRTKGDVRAHPHANGK